MDQLPIVYTAEDEKTDSIWNACQRIKRELSGALTASLGRTHAVLKELGYDPCNDFFRLPYVNVRTDRMGLEEDHTISNLELEEMTETFSDPDFPQGFRFHKLPAWSASCIVDMKANGTALLHISPRPVAYILQALLLSASESYLEQPIGKLVHREVQSGMQFCIFITATANKGSS